MLIKACHGIYVCISFVQPISFPGDVGITQLAHHSESKHFLALSHTREVFSWGSGDNGQLGLGDIK